jgi:hypothetical protein
LVPQQLKNARCLFAHPEHISTQPSTFASSATKVSINLSPNRLPAFHAHRITAQRTLPPPQRLNAQTPAKLPLKVISIVMQTPIVFLFLRPQTSSASASQVSMELARLVQVNSESLWKFEQNTEFNSLFRHVRWFLRKLRPVRQRHQRVAVMSLQGILHWTQVR